jgi:hypothetical protein
MCCIYKSPSSRAANTLIITSLEGIKNGERRAQLIIAVRAPILNAFVVDGIIYL